MGDFHFSDRVPHRASGGKGFDGLPRTVQNTGMAHRPTRGDRRHIVAISSSRFGPSRSHMSAGTMRTTKAWRGSPR